MNRRELNANTAITTAAKLGARLDVDKLLSEQEYTISDQTVNSYGRSSPETINTIMSSISKSLYRSLFISRESFRKVVLTAVRGYYQLLSIQSKLSELKKLLKIDDYIFTQTPERLIESTAKYDNSNNIITTEYLTRYVCKTKVYDMQAVGSTVVSAEYNPNGKSFIVAESDSANSVAVDILVSIDRDFNLLSLNTIGNIESLSVYNLTTGVMVPLILGTNNKYISTKHMPAGNYRIILKCIPSKSRSGYTITAGINALSCFMVSYDNTGSATMWVVNNASGIYASGVEVIADTLSNNGSIVFNLAIPDIANDLLVIEPGETIKLSNVVFERPKLLEYDPNKISGDIYKYDWTPSDTNYPERMPAINHIKIIPGYKMCQTWYNNSNTESPRLANILSFGKMMPRSGVSQSPYSETILFYVFSYSDKFVSIPITCVDSSCLIMVNGETVGNIVAAGVSTSATLNVKLYGNTMNEVRITSFYNSISLIKSADGNIEPKSFVDLSTILGKDGIFISTDRFIVSSSRYFSTLIPYYEFIFNTYSDSTKYCGYKLEDQTLSIYLRPTVSIPASAVFAYYKSAIKTASITVDIARDIKSSTNADQSAPCVSNISTRFIP